MKIRKVLPKGKKWVAVPLKDFNAENQRRVGERSYQEFLDKQKPCDYWQVTIGWSTPIALPSMHWIAEWKAKEMGDDPNVSGSNVQAYVVTCDDKPTFMGLAVYHYPGIMAVVRAWDHSIGTWRYLVLYQYRAYSMNPENPEHTNLFASPVQGYLHHGDDAATAAKREIGEEAGLTLEDEPIDLGWFNFDPTRITNDIRCFLVTVSLESVKAALPSDPNESEIAAVDLLTENEIWDCVAAGIQDGVNWRGGGLNAFYLAFAYNRSETKSIQIVP